MIALFILSSNYVGNIFVYYLLYFSVLKMVFLR
jgi:hypothetical protein